MSILDNLDELRNQIKEELDNKNIIISQLQKDLESIREKNEKIAQMESELQKNNEIIKELNENTQKLQNQTDKLLPKVQKLEQENKEILEFKDEIEILKTKNSSLIKKLEGYRYSIKIISSWLPSQKESIDVLINLSESKEHTVTFDELHKGTMIPAVVLKNRIIPLLVEKSLVKITGDSIKMLEIEE